MSAAEDGKLVLKQEEPPEDQDEGDLDKGVDEDALDEDDMDTDRVAALSFVEVVPVREALEPATNEV